MGRIKEFYHDLINSRDSFISDDEYFYQLHLEDLKNNEMHQEQIKNRKQINLSKWKKKI